MRQSSTLELALGARSKVAVLRVLLQSPLGFSGVALAKRTGMGLLAIQNTLSALEGIGLVEVERGNVEHRYRLNFGHYLIDHGLEALFEGEHSMRKALAQNLRRLLERTPVISAGLFGSFARGTAQPGSDIDLFIAVSTSKDQEEVGATLTEAQVTLTKRYGWPLQPVIYDKQRLRAMVKRDASFLTEVADDWQHVTGMAPAEIHRWLSSSKRPAAER
jgi:predicted nucleotidyltransferase